MMNTPAFLEKGDTVCIVAPAKAIEENYVVFAKQFLERHGFKVLLGEHVLGRHNYFSAPVYERQKDFQDALNNDEVKAIICARGGYGCVQILDSLNWAGMLDKAKWIVGFSDVSFFHQHLNYLGVESLHATMPLNFESNTKEALESLVNALTGKNLDYSWKSEAAKKGDVKAPLLGGNLSIIYSLLGSDSQPNYKGSILYLEEVGEHLYAIDRMFYALAKNGVLNKIEGLIIGGMTNISDTNPGFGESIEELILKHFRFRKIPIAFDFMAGHIDDNRALRLGAMHQFTVDEENCRLKLL